VRPAAELPGAAEPPVQVVVRGLVAGLEVEVRGQVPAARLAELVAALAAQGLEPPPRDWARTADGAPICPRHRVPMRQREKQGDQWYSHRIRTPDGTELYCRGYPGPDSPGYDVP